ncbi:MAG: hypothetical protein ABIG61_08070 [Planctomycetota bacterium]
MAQVNKDTIHFVGGSASADTNGGGCTREAWLAGGTIAGDLTKVQNANGAYLTAAAGAAATQGTGSNVRISATGIGVGVTVGVLAKLSNAVQSHYATGFYEVVVVTDNYVELGGGWYWATDTVDLVVGGALATIQYAADNISATEIDGDAVFRNRFIFVKQDTYLVSATQDFDTGLGSALKNTHKHFIGYNTTPPTNSGLSNGDMDYGGDYYQPALDVLNNDVDSTRKVTIDFQNNAVGYMFNIASGVNTHFRNFYLYDVPDGQHAIRFKTAGPSGISFKGCVFEDYENFTADQIGKGVLFDDCYMNTTNSNKLLCTDTNCTLFSRCVIKFGAADQGIWALKATFNRCLFSGGTRAFYFAYYNAILNCTFYNQTSYAIGLAGSAPGIVRNNIFYLASKDAYVIRGDSSSNSSILDFSHNCYYAPDGSVAHPYYDEFSGIDYVLPGGGNLADTDPQFVNAGAGDFRPRNPLVLRGGEPDIEGNPTQMGAVLQKYQFKSRGRTANRGRMAIIR